MGCLVAILLFVFFPIVYMWFQLRRGMNQFNRQFNQQQSKNRNTSSDNKQNTQDNDGQNDRTGYEKKKHVFRDNEGEYVDFVEE